jgi:hypothetical protein
MVKGVSRRVVLVRPEANDVFEQAIFLVRGDKLDGGEITGEMLLRQAEQAAQDVQQRRTDARTRFMPGALLGAAFVGLVWFLVSVL